MPKRIKQILLKVVIALLSPLFQNSRKVPSSFQTVLFICSEGLGNAIMALPTLAVLKSERPEIRLFVWTNSKPIAQLLQRVAFIDRVLIAPKSLSGLIKSVIRLRSFSFDWVGLSFPTFTIQYQLLALLIRAKFQVSHRYSSMYFQAIEPFFSQILPIDPRLHDVEQNGKLLDTLGLPIEKLKNKLQLQSDFISSSPDPAEPIAQQNLPTVLFHPGSKPGHSYKQWPLANFIRVAQILREERRAHPIFLLGPDDLIFAKEIRKNKMAIVQSNSMDETIRLLSSCSLVICNDSGIMHLASLMGVTIIVIWGATNIKRNGPWTPKAHILTRNLQCQPCVHYEAFQYCEMGGPPFPCLEIQPEQVVKKIRDALNRTPPLSKA